MLRRLLTQPFAPTRLAKEVVMPSGGMRRCPTLLPNMPLLQSPSQLLGSLIDGNSYPSSITRAVAIFNNSHTKMEFIFIDDPPLVGENSFIVNQTQGYYPFDIFKSQEGEGSGTVSEKQPCHSIYRLIEQGSTSPLPRHHKLTC